MECQPRQEPLDERGPGHGYFGQLISTLARGDYASAASALERASRLDPTNEELPLLAAMLYMDDDGLGRAAELALQAIETRPFNPAAMNLLAVVCLEALRPDLARKVLERTISI